MSTVMKPTLNFFLIELKFKYGSFAEWKIKENYVPKHTKLCKWI